MSGKGVNERVRAALLDRCGVSPGDHLLVAVSGGPDSVTLLHVLCGLAQELSLRLSVVHVDHGLRGAESDREEQFVRDLAGRLGLPFYAAAVRLDPGSDLSTQMQARALRLSELERIRKASGADKIALAHNRDDQAETVLLRVLRGTSLDGLAGILPRRDRFIHPLLEVSRADIEEYLRCHRLECCRDSSNLSVKYLRNRVRHELLPLLQTYNLNIKESLAQLAALIQEDRALMEAIVDGAWKEVQAPTYPYGLNVCLDWQALLAQPPALARRLVLRGCRMLRAQGMEAQHVQAILKLAPGARISLPDRLVAERHHGLLLLAQRVPAFAQELPVPGEVAVAELGCSFRAEVRLRHELPAGEFPPADADECWLDADRVSDGVTLRNRRPGDRFVPLGMAGSQKLKQFFGDAKLPKALRSAVPLVVVGDEIAWVVGMRIGDRFKVRDDTERVVVVSRLRKGEFVVNNNEM